MKLERLSFHQSVTGGKTNLEKIRGGTELTKSARMPPVSDRGCPSSYFDRSHIILGIILVIIITSIVIIEFNKPQYTGNVIKQKNIGISIGKSAPDFELENLLGKKVKLSDFRNKIIILNFWASWCQPCKEEMPLFENIYRNNKDRIVIIGINLQENRENIENFVKKLGITFPILLDPNAEVKDLYNVFTQPVTYFIDKDGKIADKKFGQITSEEINEKVDKLLN